jgi:hypothetical protein
VAVRVDKVWPSVDWDPFGAISGGDNTYTDRVTAGLSEQHVEKSGCWFKSRSDLSMIRLHNL